MSKLLITTAVAKNLFIKTIADTLNPVWNEWLERMTGAGSEFKCGMKMMFIWSG